jgi:hypothetical protein
MIHVLVFDGDAGRFSAIFHVVLGASMQHYEVSDSIPNACSERSTAYFAGKKNISRHEGIL